MIRVGDHVVIQKAGGEHLRICKVKRQMKILIEKLRFEIDGAIDQPYGLYEVSAGKLTHVCTDGITDMTAGFDFHAVNASSSKTNGNSTPAISRSSTEEMSGGNAAQTRQKVTQDEIIRMKDTGVPAEQLVAKLVDGSASFSERTVYSQNKYINKKAKKHSDHVYIMKPTLRLVAESYYKKDPERVAHLRIDLLSHIIALSGIHHGSRCIIFEQCLGMLTSAVISRLGGSGACIFLHRGDTAQAIPSIDSMDFSKEIISVFLPLRITSLLKGSVDENEEIADCAIAKHAISLGDKNSDERESKIKVIEGKESDEEEQMEMENESEETASAPVATSSERKAERQRLERFAWQIMQNGEIEILFIASKSVNPVEVLERTWSSLQLSATIVVYCPVVEPIYATYHWLKAKNAVQVQVVDAFYRNYQVIPDRSHPVMQQLVTGGYILSAVKVEQR